MIDINKMDRLMKEKNLTNEAASEIMGISRQMVSGIRRGTRTPNAIVLKALADYLDVKVDELYVSTEIGIA